MALYLCSRKQGSAVVTKIDLTAIAGIDAKLAAYGAVAADPDVTDIFTLDSATGAIVVLAPARLGAEPRQ